MRNVLSKYASRGFQGQNCLSNDWCLCKVVVATKLALDDKRKSKGNLCLKKKKEKKNLDERTLMSLPAPN